MIASARICLRLAGASLSLSFKFKFKFSQMQDNCLLLELILTRNTVQALLPCGDSDLDRHSLPGRSAREPPGPPAGLLVGSPAAPAGRA